MKTAKAPFLPLKSDVDDDRIEQLAREKGVGTLAHPPKASPPIELPMPQPVAQENSATEAGATPRSRMKTVNLELPDYVWTELKIQAVNQQTSLRHVVMSALKRAGVTIADVDMVEDGRRLRGNSSGS